MKDAFKNQQDDFEQEKNELECKIQELTNKNRNYEKKINELTEMCQIKEKKLQETDCVISTKVIFQRF